MDDRTVVLGLTAQSYKKTGVNTLVDDIQFHTFLLRCGWMAQNVNTIFAYVFNNEKKDSACVKVLVS